MTGLERVQNCMDGEPADKVPLFPIYDIGYIMALCGGNVRDFSTAGMQERTEYIDQAFLRHKTDGYFVHCGTDDSFHKSHIIEEKTDDFWVYRSTNDGERFRLTPHGNKFDLEGKPVAMLNSFFESQIRCKEDVKRLVPQPMDRQKAAASGYFHPISTLSNKYANTYFSFQISTPFVYAIHHCGSYQAGLYLLADNKKLFCGLMEAVYHYEEAKIALGKKAGADGIWFTSYYTGADTISPSDYQEMVFPFESRLCKKAKEEGLDVQYWFLGDCRPLIPFIKELPFDAVVLEQGRKGYSNNLKELRSALGMNRCIFSYTYEDDFVRCNTRHIAETFSTQYQQAGKNMPFVAGTTIMPSDAVPEAMDFYSSFINEYE